MSRGKFIVIEGGDGSGKGTQFEILIKKLRKLELKFTTQDFPQYEKESSYFVRQYLTGEYGQADDIGPYKGSVFYALDRFQASFRIRQALDQGAIVISNRYVASNMAHQGGKIRFKRDRLGYFKWLSNFEYKIMGIPKPDLNIVLHVEAKAAQQLVDSKNKRDYIDNSSLANKKRDIHEDNLDHLKKAEKVYTEICELFPEEFRRIECMGEDGILSIEEVSDLIWQNVEPLLN